MKNKNFLDLSGQDLGIDFEREINKNFLKLINKEISFVINL